MDAMGGHREDDGCENEQHGSPQARVNALVNHLASLPPNWVSEVCQYPNRRAKAWLTTVRTRFQGMKIETRAEMVAVILLVFLAVVVLGGIWRLVT